MSDETTVGREPITIVEIEQPSCLLDYSNSPCEAVLGDTGTRKCFNTQKSCQDRANYDPSVTFFWRFAKPSAVMPRDLYDESAGVFIKTNPIPSLLSVSTNPSRINVGAGSDDSSPLGRRATVAITLQDNLWDDSLGDNYVDERPTGAASSNGDAYNPIDRGTFWAKWLARNPFHTGYLVRIYDGYQGQALGSMQVRLYILERIDGPTGDRVVLTAKDPLTLADSKRTQFPAASAIDLFATINDSTTTVDVVSAESELTADFGNTGSTRYLRIGNEIISYTGHSGTPSQWVLAGVVRGVLGTDADDHTVDDKCQRVGRYDSLECWDIAKDLLLSHTTLDPAFINGTQWDDEGNAFLSSFVLEGTVAEPTPVINLVGELTEQCPFYMWWDERNQTIPIRAVRPALGDGVAEINDTSHIIRGSAVLTEDQNQRVSRVFIYYKKINPTIAADEIGNYARLRGRIDADAESSDQYGDVRIRQIFSRWLTTAPQAIQTADRIGSRFRNAVETLSLKVDAKDRSIELADVLLVTTRTVVDETGSARPEQWQVITFEEVIAGEVIRLDMQRFEYLGRFWIWADEAAPDYSAATDEEKAVNAYWSDADGSPGNGDFGYQWV